jgi:diguanylate cyclase (GGDEF)-like protein
MKFQQSKTKKDLFVFFILGVVIVLIIISGSTLFNVRRMIDTASRSYITSVSETVYAKTLGYLKPVDLLNEFIFDVQIIQPDFLQSISSLNTIGKSFLTAYPQLQSFIIGNEKGQFYLLKKNPNSTFDQILIDPTQFSNKTVNHVLDPNLKILSTAKSDVIDFDPRVRPWYKGSKYSEHNFWTPIYIFYIDQTPGLTIAHSFLDKGFNYTGSYGFDIDIYGLSEFFENLDPVKGGQIMLINEQKQIVAYSDPTQVFDRSLNYDTLPFEKFENGLFQALLSTPGVQDNIVTFTRDNIHYIGLVKSIKKDLNIPWRILIIYPLETFFAPYKLTVYFVMATTVFSILLLSVLFLYRYREIKATDKLVYYANHDQLTQLKNRHYFASRYHNNIQQSVRTFTLILADIDHFKVINDTYGHSIGDLVLIHFASLIRKRLSDNQIAFRWGGEEFLIVLENQTLEEAITFSSTLKQDILEQPFKLEALSVHISLSFGIAERRDQDGFSDTIHRADEKLYEAKANGRDQIRY